MPLSLAEINALLPDNTTEEITPADHRATMEAMFDRARFGDTPDTTEDADDVYWDGSIAAGMDIVTVSGSQVITETRGLLSVVYSGQSGGDYNCLLKAHTFSIGDSFAVAVRMTSVIAASTISNAGIVFTNGITGAATAVAAHIIGVNTDGQVARLYTRSGTLTAFSTVTPNQNLRNLAPWFWLRLTYQAANTWRKQISPDGISWTTLGGADAAVTLSPTHVGVIWSVDGGGNEAISTFGPILKLA